MIVSRVFLSFAGEEVIFTAGENKCGVCPPEVLGRCDGAVVPLPGGYWRWSNVSYGVYECPLKLGCRDGTNTSLDLCRVGYEGYYCSKCAWGYYSPQEVKSKK